VVSLGAFLLHLVYIDDSAEDRWVYYSALAIPVDQWRECLDHLADTRRQLWSSDQVYIRKELHATELLGGRGHYSKEFLPKGARARIFDFVLCSVVRLPGVQLFNGASHKSNEETLFERILNRINVNMSSKASSHALLISDEGKNYDYMLRRMRHFNYIPSKFGGWGPGQLAKNIPVNRIVEDLSYRDSKRSSFIQMADLCAYALLRRERPLASKTKYGLNNSFYLLEPIMVKVANGKDPYGIVRV
jgi:Protein of unknown function (DUF3800)